MSIENLQEELKQNQQQRDEIIRQMQMIRDEDVSTLHYPTNWPMAGANHQWPETLVAMGVGVITRIQFDSNWIKHMRGDSDRRVGAEEFAREMDKVAPGWERACPPQHRGKSKVDVAGNFKNRVYYQTYSEEEPLEQRAGKGTSKEFWALCDRYLPEIEDLYWKALHGLRAEGWEDVLQQEFGPFRANTTSV